MSTITISLSAVKAPTSKKLFTLLAKKQKLQAELRDVVVAIREEKAASKTTKVVPKTASVPVKKLGSSDRPAKANKLPMACTETATIPADLKGKFSSRLRALEKKHGIVRAGVSDAGVNARGKNHYTFHYERQPGWSAFKSDIHRLWSSFVSDYPKAKANMR